MGKSEQRKTAREKYLSTCSNTQKTNNLFPFSRHNHMDYDRAKKMGYEPFCEDISLEGYNKNLFHFLLKHRFHSVKQLMEQLKISENLLYQNLPYDRDYYKRILND